MKFNKQSGQILVSAAIALVVLLGFAGLAMDMGVLRYERRLQQTAADAAAVAGASNVPYASGVAAGGQNASTQNGFTDNNGGAGCSGGAVGCISVAINNPPNSGPHTGDAKYVEAIVTAVQPTFFMNIFGVNKETVAARAVATNISGSSKQNCLITLGPPTAAIDGVSVQGNASINAPHCGIADDGNFDTTGNGYSVTANTFAVTGQCLGNDCTSPNTTCTSSATCPSYSAPSTPDPLANGPTPIQPPSQPAYSSSCPTPGVSPCDWSSGANATVTIQPGTYNSISIGKNSVVTLAQGIYYINGAIAGDTANPNAGLNMDGTGTLRSAGYLGGATPCGADPSSQIPGVMIYFTNTSTMNKFTGGGGANVPDLQLCPMNSTQPENPNGTYTGILMYQDPADTVGPFIYGDNKSTYNGILYFPTVQITLYGNSQFTANGPLISYSLSINGSPTVTLGNFPGGTPPTSNFTVPVLVE